MDMNAPNLVLSYEQMRFEFRRDLRRLDQSASQFGKQALTLSVDMGVVVLDESPTGLFREHEQPEVTLALMEDFEANGAGRSEMDYILDLYSIDTDNKPRSMVSGLIKDLSTGWDPRERPQAS